MGEHADYIIQQMLDGKRPSGYERKPKMSNFDSDWDYNNDSGKEPVEIEGYIFLISASGKAVLFSDEAVRSKAQWIPISQLWKMQLLDEKWEGETYEGPNADEIRYYFAQSKSGYLSVLITIPMWLAIEKEFTDEED